MDDDMTAARPDWAKLLRTYQRGPASESGSILIAALNGQLRARAQMIPVAPPVIDRDDIWQALCVETLVAAASMELPPDPRWIPKMLVERAGRVVARGVHRELRLTTGGLDEQLPALAQPAIGSVPATFGVAGIADPDDATLVHQRRVLGLGYSDLAGAAQVTPAAMRQRVSRARRGLHAHILRTAELKPADLTLNRRGSNAATVTKPPRNRRLSSSREGGAATGGQSKGGRHGT